MGDHEDARVWQPARGYLAVTEMVEASEIIRIRVDPRSRSTVTHRGRVVALGPAPRTVTGAVVPWQVAVGDVVQFHFVFHRRNREISWPPTGETVVMLTHDELDMVIDGGCQTTR